MADPVPGTVCADGTVYAGRSDDGNTKMYTTRCDEGMSWSGVACTGSRTQLPWNNGNTDNFVLVTATQNSVTGKNNTLLLAGVLPTLNGIDSDNGTSGMQLHQAAHRCASKSGAGAHGHEDWYLPASLELQTLWQNMGAIRNFVDSTSYWSSTENTISGAFRRDFSSGSAINSNKYAYYFVRCVRRD